MDRQVNLRCDQHSDSFECPDNLVSYISKFDEYGLIIHDGGTASCLINFCPWCGTKLPESKRYEWFDTLESLGFDDPAEDDISREYRSNEWYEGKA